MEISIGTTICDGCGGPAIVGLGEVPLCGPCFDDALARERVKIEAVLATLDPACPNFIRSPLLCGDDEP